MTNKVLKPIALPDTLFRVNVFQKNISEPSDKTSMNVPDITQARRLVYSLEGKSENDKSCQPVYD